MADAMEDTIDDEVELGRDDLEVPLEDIPAPEDDEIVEDADGLVTPPGC